MERFLKLQLINSLISIEQRRLDLTVTCEQCFYISSCRNNVGKVIRAQTNHDGVMLDGRYDLKAANLEMCLTDGNLQFSCAMKQTTKQISQSGYQASEWVLERMESELNRSLKVNATKSSHFLGRKILLDTRIKFHFLQSSLHTRLAKYHRDFFPPLSPSVSPSLPLDHLSSLSTDPSRETIYFVCVLSLYAV